MCVEVFVFTLCGEVSVGQQASKRQITLDAIASFFAGIKKAPAMKAEAQAKVYNKPLYPT